MHCTSGLAKGCLIRASPQHTLKILKGTIMKNLRLIGTLLFLIGTITTTPVLAQRGGGTRSNGSSFSSSRSSGSSLSRSSSFSSSRSSGGGSSFSSSRSNGSSSSSSRSSSGGSRFSSSRSSLSSSESSSYSRHSHSGSSRSNNSPSNPSSSSRISQRPANANTIGQYIGSRRSANNASRTGSIPLQDRTPRPDAVSTSLDGVNGRSGRETASLGNGRPSGIAPEAPRTPHHSPTFIHPHNNQPTHCHQIFWDPIPPRPFYGPGFWTYCNSYWFDYHVTDIVVVRQYVEEKYNMNLLSYAISGDYMYALVHEPGKHTYLQIYDKNDKLLAEQQVSRKYIKLEVDPQNGGCWIMKKKDKDPLLFLYLNDRLFIYEADK